MVKAIIGLQWGDEGKGRIVRLMASQTDIGIRYNGGNNAGHTVIDEHGKTILHYISSVILDPNPKVKCIIGNGCVIDPPSLVQEIRQLNDKGIETKDRLFVSPQAHIVTSCHRRAETRGIAEKIDTTRKGIGPCSADKYARKGTRMESLKTRKLKRALREFLCPYIKEVKPMIWKAIDQEKNILCEGAQGFLLDIDFGTYPYCTSSSTGSAGIYQGTGIPSGTPIEVIGVAKAYTTRVGNGPFPTELTGKLGDYLRKRGNEFGATTGRPRRCGWLDIPLLRYACKMNGVQKLIITKLDVLDELEEIRVCIKYKEGEVPEVFPSESTLVTPIYEKLHGWQKPTSECRKPQDLPREARTYLERVKELVGVRISKVSVGPKTEQIIEM